LPWYFGCGVQCLDVHRRLTIITWLLVARSSPLVNIIIIDKLKLFNVY